MNADPTGIQMISGDSGRTVTYNSDTDTYRVTHDFAETTTITDTVSLALEEVVAVEELALSQTLYELLDPDGLDRIFEPTARTPRNNGHVAFSIDGVDVVVHASGDIEITPP